MKPYRIVGELKRFDQRKTAFSRRPAAAAAASCRHEEDAPAEPPADDRPGYTPEDRALYAAAWVPDRLLRKHWRDPPAEPGHRRHEPGDWQRFTQRVKEAGRFYGAAMVGVTRVNPLWLYADRGDGTPPPLPEGLTTAVVMGIEMDYDGVATSPALPAAAATAKGYSQMAFAATCVARYLLELGFRAIPSGNDTALSIPLAIDAGLGECGRHGMLITPDHGPRVRLCKVFTDAALLPDRPAAFGFQTTCQQCRQCVTACPVGAIPDGEMTETGPSDSNNSGVLKWHVNPEKCLAFWQVNGACCANCLNACPYNKKGP